MKFSVLNSPKQFQAATSMAACAMGIAIVLVIGTAAFSGVAFASDHGTGREYESKIYGTIDTIPPDLTGVWVVGGRTITVTKDTRIKEKHGKAATGAYVEVDGSATGASFTAYEIEVKRSDHR